ncbi:MAG: T9SS type A sorting domain-containing protein [Owenweeksia sp.]|nr:T9SS type A sorting domain-containing protein [Owenweeksia sp.]
MTNSWFNQNNNSPANADFVISRFKVTDINQGLTVESYKAGEHILQFFPNPAGSLLNVSMPGTSIERIRIYGMHGKHFRDKKYTANGPSHTLVDVSALPKGVFMVEVNGQYIAKFIKD